MLAVKTVLTIMRRRVMLLKVSFDPREDIARRAYAQ